jgi:hypothetical protein
MENIINAVNSLPSPLLYLVYFTYFLAVANIAYFVINVSYLAYSKITLNWQKLKFGTVLLLLKAKKLIRSFLFRQPATRYNMQEFPLSDTEIVLDSLEERSPVPQLSGSQKPSSEIHLENQAEQNSGIKEKRIRLRKLHNGRIVEIREG